jgi:hypothetical protein
VSAAGDERGREQRPANKMQREDAERLRELLRRTQPAELDDPSVPQRIGRALARAAYRPAEREWWIRSTPVLADLPFDVL